MKLTEWGPWHDPSMQEGLAGYEAVGLHLATPPEVQATDEDTLYKVAEDCGRILTEVYQGTYPLGTGDAEALTKSVKKGETDLFTLNLDDHLVAMAAIVHQPNRAGGDIRFSELGRACGMNLPDGSHVPLRTLLRHRVPWALANRPDVDFLYSFTRSAAEPYGKVPSGKGVQSVWWGGLKHGGSSPMITSNVGPNYRLGGIEPFNGFVMPTDPEAWAVAAESNPIFVESAMDKHTVDTLIQEGTRGRVRPETITSPAGGPPLELGFTEILPPSDNVANSFIVSTVVGGNHDMGNVNAQLSDSISQRVVVEADITRTTENARVMRRLREAGFTLTGWEPSGVDYGSRALVFSRLNPLRVSEVIASGQRPEYFDDAGLPQTRIVIDTINAMLIARAHASQAGR